MSIKVIKERFKELGIRELPDNERYSRRLGVPSSSNPKKQYVVSITRYSTGKNDWGCGCPAWTRHMPRKDCKHINMVKEILNMPNSIDWLFDSDPTKLGE